MAIVEYRYYRVVNGKPAAPAATGTNRCGTGTVTCTATAPTDGSVTWWTAATGGTEVTFPQTISTSTTYYAQAHVSTGCTSQSRTAVAATIVSPSAAGSFDQGCGCNGVTRTYSGYCLPVERTQLITGNVVFSYHYANISDFREPTLAQCKQWCTHLGIGPGENYKPTYNNTSCACNGAGYNGQYHQYLFVYKLK